MPLINIPLLKNCNAPRAFIRDNTVRVFACVFLNLSVMSFPKCVTMTNNTSFFPNFAHFCTPTRCTRVHCLVLKNNPNYVNFFTRMISNFKYKCPPTEFNNFAASRWQSQCMPVSNKFLKFQIALNWGTLKSNFCLFILEIALYFAEIFQCKCSMSVHLT